MAFDKVSSERARKKRKRRFTRVTVTPEEASRAARRRKKDTVGEDEKVAAVVNTLLDQWRADPISGGTNNALSAAAVRVLIKKLAGKRSFNGSSSVFLDIGSGAGIPCIYVALRYRVRCIGVEKSAELVKRAQQFAESVGLDEHQCRFFCRDAAQLTSRFYVEQGVTHVPAFDACFGDEARDNIYRRLAGTRDGALVGCSTARTKSAWSQCGLQQVGRSTTSVKMSGRGASTFRFAVWKLTIPSQ
jgi:tRNA G46 methylase TrmB